MSRVEDKNALKLKRRSKLAIKFLGEAKKNINKRTKFYDSLEKALYNYLKAKLQIETIDIQREIIIDLLKTKGVEVTLIDGFMNILNNCEMARYSPITDLMMQHDYELAIDIIEKIDYEI